MFSVNSSESSHYEESDCETMDSSRDAIIQCPSLNQTLKSPLLDILDVLNAAENDLQELEHISLSCYKVVKVRQSRCVEWDNRALENRLLWVFKIYELIYRIENVINTLETNQQYQELLALKEWENDTAAAKQRENEIMAFVCDDSLVEPLLQHPKPIDVSDLKNAKTSDIQLFSSVTRKEHHNIRITLDVLRDRIHTHIHRCVTFSKLKAQVEQSKFACERQHLIRSLFIDTFKNHQAHSSKLYIQDMWQTRLNFSHE